MAVDELVFGVLEHMCNGALVPRSRRVRIAFEMLDENAETWVFDPLRQNRLFAREPAVDVALTITCRPRALLSMLAGDDSSDAERGPILFEGNSDALDVLIATMRRGQSSLDLRSHARYSAHRLR